MSVQRTAARHCNRWNAFWNLLHLLVHEVRLSEVECVYVRVTTLPINKVRWRNDRITGNIQVKKTVDRMVQSHATVSHCQISPSTPYSPTPSHYVLPFIGQTNLHILTKQDKVSRFCTFLRYLKRGNKRTGKMCDRIVTVYSEFTLDLVCSHSKQM